MPASTHAKEIKHHASPPQAETARTLEIQYRALQKKTPSTESDQIQLEKDKIACMRKIADLIHETYQTTPVSIPSETGVKQNSWWQYLAFGVLSIINMPFIVMGGYTGMLHLLPLIPHFPSLVCMLVGGIATLIESTMIYSFLKPMLQAGLGMKNEPPKDTLTSLHLQQFHLMKEMHAVMVDDFKRLKKRPAANYANFMGLLCLLNQDMKTVKEKPYEENTTRKRFRYALTGLNISFQITGSYFSLASLLMTLGAGALVTTPAGWAIIITFIFVQVTTSFLMRRTSLFDLLNPSAKIQNDAHLESLSYLDQSSKITDNLDTLMKLEKHPDMLPYNLPRSDAKSSVSDLKEVDSTAPAPQTRLFRAKSETHFSHPMITTHELKPS